MYVTKATTCIFFVYLEHDFALIDVKYDSSLLINEIIPECSLFVRNVILPELVSHYWSAKRYAPNSIDDQFVEIEVLQSSEAVIPSHSSHDGVQSLSPQSISFPDVNQVDDPSHSKENMSSLE